MDIVEIKSEELDLVFDLWNSVLADKWPINKEQMADRINIGINLGIKSEGKIVGFVNGQYNGTKGQVTLIMIDSNYQRKGLGTKLLNRIKELMKGHGVDELVTGAGAGSYFWPGIPSNLPEAKLFFVKNGFESVETNLDMVGNIEGYSTPPEIMEKIKDLGVTFVEANENISSDLLAFENVNFSNWTKYFEDKIKQKDFNSILVAKNANVILGSVLLFGDQGFVWSKLLPNAGGFGALGVAESQRGKGVGLALAARATEILKSRGVKNSFLGWTYLDKWYGKLGYKAWMEYDYQQANL